MSAVSRDNLSTDVVTFFLDFLRVSSLYIPRLVYYFSSEMHQLYYFLYLLFVSCTPVLDLGINKTPLFRLLFIHVFLIKHVLQYSVVFISFVEPDRHQFFVPCFRITSNVLRFVAFILNCPYLNQMPVGRLAKEVWQYKLIGGRDTGTVSYTHLDVYKRQI